MHLQGVVLRQRCVDVHYSVPKDNAADVDPNQGTLVVFNMDSAVPRQQVVDLFAQFGEVKEVRRRLEPARCARLACACCSKCAVTNVQPTILRCKG